MFLSIMVKSPNACMQIRTKIWNVIIAHIENNLFLPAGVMFVPYKESDEGFEQQYIVNYLSHFLLTVLLLPSLKEAGSSDRCSRIVNVSSCAHLFGKINFDDINNTKCVQFYKCHFLTRQDSLLYRIN